jgi:hypothetical protein
VLVIAMTYAHPENLRAPAWVAYATGAAFVGGGCALVAAALEAGRIEILSGFVALGGLLTPFLWVAFGPGPRECSVYLPFVTTAGAEWVCRGGFGIAALLGLAILALFLRRVLRPDADHPGA